MSKNQFQYCAITNGIEVQVRPFFAKDLSEPLSHKYVYIYKVKITNKSENSIKLVSRKWHVIEDDGTHNVISGDGVIGQQPEIKSSEMFEYASQAILFCKSGMMFGEYYCKLLDNESLFSVQIPTFSLDF